MNEIIGEILTLLNFLPNLNMYLYNLRIMK